MTSELFPGRRESFRFLFDSMKNEIDFRDPAGKNRIAGPSGRSSVLTSKSSSHRRDVLPERQKKI